jgi:hypothetical protein
MHKTLLILFALAAGVLSAADAPKYDYRLLATTRTSTMEKEMNAAADSGFVFADVMGGQSAFGGKEVLVVMSKPKAAPAAEKRRYRLLATSRTSTMEKELNQAGAEGFDYCGQTVFESALGGKEVSVILEQNPAQPARRISYKVLATSRTSTLEKELNEAGAAGFEFLGVVVGSTAFGGKEVVSVMRKYE